MPTAGRGGECVRNRGPASAAGPGFGSMWRCLRITIAWSGSDGVRSKAMKTVRSRRQVGLYSGRVADQHFDYVMPQENGNKTDVRWLRLKSEDGGLLVSGAGEQARFQRAGLCGPRPVRFEDDASPSGGAVRPSCIWIWRRWGWAVTTVGRPAYTRSSYWAIRFTDTVLP